MFQLTKDEVELVKSQFVTSRENTFFSGQGGGRRKYPYAFTEQGIYMLATVLKGELATKQSIFIMRAFKEIIVI
ncbi:ORF6N domain-containing protein [Oribacterium sp. WCC10]|uniref:ORF6N domain-containing protein n=1 Tax=Oribacterium sp. WCC10 TaxID=1855343 RepID=UPI0008F1F2DD|nr:ORF6N domain-containing protein [Oribacterium sp. WCC10]